MINKKLLNIYLLSTISFAGSQFKLHSSHDEHFSDHSSIEAVVNKFKMEIVKSGSIATQKKRFEKLMARFETIDLSNRDNVLSILIESLGIKIRGVISTDFDLPSASSVIEMYLDQIETEDFGSIESVSNALDSVIKFEQQLKTLSEFIQLRQKKGEKSIYRQNGYYAFVEKDYRTMFHVILQKYTTGIIDNVQEIFTDFKLINPIMENIKKEYTLSQNHLLSRNYFINKINNFQQRIGEFNRQLNPIAYNSIIYSNNPDRIYFSEKTGRETCRLLEASFAELFEEVSTTLSNRLSSMPLRDQYLFTYNTEKLLNFYSEVLLKVRRLNEFLSENFESNRLTTANITLRIRRICCNDSNNLRSLLDSDELSTMKIDRAITILNEYQATI